jgi:hypothetical protein
MAMHRLPVIVLLVGGLLVSGLLLAQDPPKLKGFLPPNFGKLGLSEEQKQQIYKLQADYDTKYTDLENQLKKLRAEERAALEKVLTETQRAKRRELRLGEKPEETPKKPGS